MTIDPTVTWQATKDLSFGAEAIYTNDGGWNYEEREEGERQSRVIREDPVRRAHAQPSDEALLRHRAEQPEKTGEEYVEEEYEDPPLRTCP